jgi:methionyl-tRNA synthetase
MAEDNISKEEVTFSDELPSEYLEKMNDLNTHKASEIAWQYIAQLDKYIQDTQPFKLVKENQEEGKKIISELVSRLYTIAHMVEPFIPTASRQILEAIAEHKKPETPIFNRV